MQRNQYVFVHDKNCAPLDGRKWQRPRQTARSNYGNSRWGTMIHEEAAEVLKLLLFRCEATYHRGGKTWWWVVDFTENVIIHHGISNFARFYPTVFLFISSIRIFILLVKIVNSISCDKGRRFNTNADPYMYRIYC